MSVQNFDTPPAPPVQSEPPRFRLFGREWTCQPAPTEEAVTAARMGHVLAPFADTDPAVYAAVLADLALRFVGWSVADADGWAAAVAGERIEAAMIINVMAWLAAEYTPAEPATMPVEIPPSRRTDIGALRTVAAAAGLGDVIAGG